MYNVNPKFLPNVAAGEYTVNVDQALYEVRGAMNRALVAYLKSIGVTGVVTVVVGYLKLNGYAASRYVRIVRNNVGNIWNKQDLIAHYVAKIHKNWLSAR